MLKCLLRYLAVVLFLTGCFLSDAHPYCFSAWTGMIGEKTVSVSPSFYATVSNPVESSFDLIAGYGIMDNFEVVANFANLAVMPSFGYGNSWVITRYDLWKNNIIGLMVGYVNPSSFFVSPQYHFFWENDNFAFEFNFASNINFSDVTKPSFNLVLAPVYKVLPDMLCLFVEVNPSFAIGVDDTFDAVLVPGIWLSAPNTCHQVCISTPVSGLANGPVGVSVYAWYSFTFSIGR